MLLRTFTLSIGFFALIACQDNRNPEQSEVVDNKIEKREYKSMFEPIQDAIQEFENHFDSISEERKTILSDLSAYIVDCHKRGETARLTFICTHNSRRSHLAQVWAQTAADFYGIENVETFSGGTEATAFNPRAVKALESDGFKILVEGTDNPMYQVQHSSDKIPMTCFSKKFTDSPNPQTNFCAVMTCSDADEACPIVPGASERVSTPYVDPKVSDGTSEEEATYLERSHQIGTELSWVMQHSSNELKLN